MRAALVVLTMALTACGPDLALDGGDDGFGGDTGGSCEFGLECDGPGLCWALAPGWSAWARYAEPAAGLDLGCHAVPNTDAHVCVVVVDCVPLLARPVAEVSAEASPCAGQGPWVTFEDGGVCYGLLGDALIELR